MSKLLIGRVLIRGSSGMKTVRSLQFSHTVGEVCVEFALHRMSGAWAVSDVSTGWCARSTVRLPEPLRERSRWRATPLTPRWRNTVALKRSLALLKMRSNRTPSLAADEKN